VELDWSVTLSPGDSGAGLEEGSVAETSADAAAEALKTLEHAAHVFSKLVSRRMSLTRIAFLAERRIKKNTQHYKS
jgi:hypothetical protein